jgi:hypothetical protein
MDPSNMTPFIVAVAHEARCDTTKRSMSGPSLTASS